MAKRRLRYEPYLSQVRKQWPWREQYYQWNTRQTEEKSVSQVHELDADHNLWALSGAKIVLLNWLQAIRTEPAQIYRNQAYADDFEQIWQSFILRG